MPRGVTGTQQMCDARTYVLTRTNIPVWSVVIGDGHYVIDKKRHSRSSSRVRHAFAGLSIRFNFCWIVHSPIVQQDDSNYYPCRDFRHYSTGGRHGCSTAGVLFSALHARIAVPCQKECHHALRGWFVRFVKMMCMIRALLRGNLTIV
jgi:hypothetical protein